jgi:hypothetical protein
MTYSVEENDEPRRRGRKPLTEEEKEERRAVKREQQKTYYHSHKPEYSEKYFAYLLNDNVSNEEIEGKLHKLKTNYDLINKIYEMKKTKKCVKK